MTPDSPQHGIPRIIRRKVINLSWLIIAWWVLGLSRLVILLVPFRHFAAILGRYGGVSPWVPMVTAEQRETARWVRGIVARAARRTPWQSNCFPQAITAQLLLRLHGIPFALFFGLARDAASEVRAHAWVASGPVYVTGGDSFGQFTVVGCFYGPPALLGTCASDATGSSD